MRDGILDQLPKTLPKEQIVMVFGPPENPGQNALKSLINDLNRDGGAEWIRGEFRSQVDSAKVLSRTTVVLTMTGLTHGALANVRRSAINLRACCPNQALTMGETKEILRHLSEARKGIVAPKNNGNGLHPTLPGKGEGQRFDTLAKSAQETGEMFSTVIRPVPDTPLEEARTIIPEAEETAQEEILNDPEEVNQALATIQKFRDVSDETEVAVMMVGDRLKVISAERDNLRRQLGARDEEVVRLRSELEAARKIVDEGAALLKKNEQLEVEVSKLRTTLDQFDNLIKGVKQK